MSEAKKTTVQISRKGLLIWAGLVFFVAVWMFILGILVGRGTAPVNLDADRLQKELARLKEVMAAKEQAEVEAQAAGQKDGKADLGFYEALKEPPPDKTYKVLGQDPVSPRPAQPKPAPAPAPHEKDDNKKEAVVAAKTRAEPDIAPAPSAPTTKAQPPKPTDKAARATGRFTIQVAALKEAAGADKLVDMLRKKGYPAYQIRSGGEDKDRWYRVRVGAFRARGEAEEMLKKLQGEKLKGLIVSN